jgi:hypothetical protein
LLHSLTLAAWLRWQWGQRVMEWRLAFRYLAEKGVDGLETNA